MKKFMWALSVAGLISLIGCGGGSKEAKELLQRILSLVGIPQTIVLQICQDKDGDGFCGINETSQKMTINKGDNLNNILQKIKKTAEGKYLLETATPELPLLLVLKHNESESYTKEFTIPFTGLEKKQTEKDLSLLQAMVDAGYLTAKSIEPIKTLENEELFYEKLLKNFELNLKTLDEKGISSPRAVLANIKDVAQELKDDGLEDNLTNEINACGDNETCVEERIVKTVIEEDEAVVIVNDETSQHKQLLSSKVLYLSSTEANQTEIKKFTFNANVNGVTWIVTKGVNKGKTGSDSVLIEGNKLIIVGKQTHNFLKETADYLLYENENGVKEKYFFDEGKLLINSSALAKLIAGRTLYKPDNHKGDKTITSFSFNQGMTKVVANDSKNFDITTTNDTFSFDFEGKKRIYKMVAHNSDYLNMDYLEDKTDRVKEKYRFYFDKNKAQKYLDTLSSNEDNGSATPNQFTEKLVSKNPWYIVEIGTNNVYCNGKFTMDTNYNLTVSWHDNGTTDSVSLQYSIENGKFITKHDGKTETSTLQSYENNIIVAEKVAVHDSDNSSDTMQKKWFANQLDAENFLSQHNENSCFP